MTDSWSWFELEMRLLLVGCDESRRPTLRAARDRARPLVWDRHLAIASGPPADVEGDLRALDRWYREGEASRFSVVARHGREADAWAQALEPFLVEVIPIALMEGEVLASDESVFSSGLTRPGPAVGLELLTRFRRALVRDRGDDPGPLPAQLAGALAQRSFIGWTPRVLAAIRGDEVIAVIVYSCSGEHGWMEDLETRDAWRGQGLGRRLFRAALGELGRLGARRVGFSARMKDWPREWYQRQGFRIVDQVVRFERIL